MAVFVLDRRKKPLMPCSEKRARQLLATKRARIHRMVPFTIRLVDRTAGASAFQAVRLKLDPGSKTTGVALVREGVTSRDQTVLALIEVEHRSNRIRDALAQRRTSRRRRRNQLRYRPARFNNRPKPKGWLAPSLRHRVETIESWTSRLTRVVPLTAIDQQLAKFDTQAMQDPTIEGVRYQQGTLFEYEVREYCLEKWGRVCMYCDAADAPLEVEHIVSKAKGGSNRPSNLGLACTSCNQSKGSIPIKAFVKDPKRLARIRAHMKAPLRDAAAMNATRFAQLRMLQTFGVSVHTASGGRTKFNRKLLGVSRSKALNAACVGDIATIRNWRQPALVVRCTGRGAYQRTRLTKHGFPRGYLMREKSAFGFSTGDMVVAAVPSGKNAGVHRGRVAIRASGRFNVTTSLGVVQRISHRHMRLLQRSDGYGYWPSIANSPPSAPDQSTISSARGPYDS
jgi:5-methylcytosine-specific restriction endonuclease McrA